MRMLAGIAFVVICALATNTWADERLSFLVLGTSTPQDVLLQLGRPHMSFENERIFVFLLSDKKGSLRALEVRPPGNVALDLVVEFDTDNKLLRYSVVQQR